MVRVIAGLLFTGLGIIWLPTLRAQDDRARVEDLFVMEDPPEVHSIGDCAACEPADCDLICPGWFVAGEYLQLRLRRRGLDYAMATDGEALAAGAGTVQNVEFLHEPGYRIGLGYVTPTRWELGFRFTGLNADVATSAEAPAGGNLWATRSHPARNEEATTAAAFAEFDYRLFDLEIGRWFTVNDFAAFRCFGGLSWIDTDQQLRIDYDGNDFNNGVVLDRQNDTGFGIRLGGEGHWDVNCLWSVFARIDARVMFSNASLRLLETNNAGADVITDVTDRFTAPVSHLGAAIGIAYHVQALELRGGYEFANWFGLGNRTGFDGTHVGAYDPASNDILLDGFFFSASLNY